MAGVIRQVDEFVPQFYDVAPERSGEKGAGVARLIEPGWGKVFDAFGKPYRIAVASFGRIVELSGRKGKKRACASDGISIIDASPLDFLAKNRLVLKSKSVSRAGERLVSFTYPRAGKETCPEHEPGDTVKMIIPTRDSVSRAYGAALKMGSWCRGVLFFRWPIQNEAMVFSQSELELIMAGKEPSSGAAPGLETEDGLCVAVNCVDLLLSLRDRFPEKPVTVRIHSSLELEYFLPDEHLKTRVIGPRTIEATIPAYAGVPEIRLGRAVTRDATEFRVEETGR